MFSIIWQLHYHKNSFLFHGVFIGGRSTCVVPGSQEPFIRKGDVIGVALDLNIPSITFYFNGVKIRGAFKNFNVDGMFFPVVSMSSKCRFDILNNPPSSRR